MHLCIPKGNAADEAGRSSESSLIPEREKGRFAAGRCFYEMTTYSEGKWTGSACRFSGHPWYSERKSGCGFAAHSQVVLSLSGPNFAGSRDHTFFIMLYHIPKENFYPQSARIDLKYRYHCDILCIVESESSR